MTRRRRRLIGLAVGAATLALLAVGWLALRGDAGAAAPASAAAAVPISVTTTRAERRDFDVVLDASGTVQPLSSVEVRPQVASTIAQVHIREGQFVEQGELMFALDNRPAQVEVARAQAQLARNQATLADAERQLARANDLLAQEFVSQSAVDTNQAQVDAQRAAVAADRAAVQAARVALGYTRIVAPGAGRVGAISVFPGSSVQPGTTATPLVTVTQLDPIAIGFNLPQRNLGDALARLRSGTAEVAAMLPGGNAESALRGKLQFIDNAVDANSGTVKAKALFANPEYRLWPGAYVNVRFGIETLKDAVVVPQAAIIQGIDGKTLYVVDDAGRAQLRKVEVLHSSGPLAAVSGLQGGERVVVEGRQNLRPGAAVAERGAPGATPADVAQSR